MFRFGRLTQLVGLNSIPVLGVIYGGWSNPTALALYWCETVMLILLICVRISVHRITTHKRGHYVEKHIKTTTSGKMRSGIGYFGTNFFWFGLIVCLFNAMFLSWAIGDQALDTINKAQLKQGVIAAAVMLTLGLVMDLAGISKRPFAWIKQMSTGALWRIFLVQIAIVLGVIGAKFFGLSRTTLLAFVALKLYTDIVAQIPSLQNQKRTPEQETLARSEEERFSGKPIPFESALIQRIDG
jgi:hypothetical protein